MEDDNASRRKGSRLGLGEGWRVGGEVMDERQQGKKNSLCSRQKCKIHVPVKWRGSGERSTVQVQGSNTV